VPVRLLKSWPLTEHLWGNSTLHSTHQCFDQGNMHDVDTVHFTKSLVNSSTGMVIPVHILKELILFLNKIRFVHTQAE
jgi:hypothetical protein